MPNTIHCQLSKKDNRLQCVLPDSNIRSPFYVEFSASRYRHLERELLIKAVGAKKNQVLTVCDLTAGFGSDAYLLHCYGCQVQLVERSPIIAQLLQDGLQRAGCDLPLFMGEAREFIAQCIAAHKQFDVIYFDPIFPTPAKNALPAKSAQILRYLAQGEDPLAAEVFVAARAIARQRIVVKRPLHGAPIVAQPLPHHAFRGKSVRFDCYLVA